MAVEIVDVRNKHTGEKTRMSVKALAWSDDFEKTPQQKAAEKAAGSGDTKGK